MKGKGGRGPLVQENLSATLGVSQDQYLFAPRGGYREAYCIGNGQVHDLGLDEVCKTLNCMVDPMKVIVKKRKETKCGKSGTTDSQ